MRSKRIKIFATICVVSSIIAACASKPEVAKSVHYQCDRGTNFSVTFIEKGFTKIRGGRNSIPRYEVKNVAADILLADGTLMKLPVQETGSGFMYSNGRYTLRGKGNEAMWSVGKMAAERCVANP